MLVEAAFALPLLIMLLSGILAYGCWFMTAHGLQQAANEAARAAVAGLTTSERRSMVDRSVAASNANSLFTGGQPIAVATSENAGFYEVRLRYDIMTVPVLAATPFPMPVRILERSAVVRISG